MHEQACKTHLDAMQALMPELEALPPEARRVVARLLQGDVDLLSAAAVQSRAVVAAELRSGTAAALQSAECLRTVVGHLIRVKVDLLSPLLFGDAHGRDATAPG